MDSLINMRKATRSNINTLKGVTYSKDNVTYHHAQRTDHIKKNVYEEKNAEGFNNGFSPCRGWRKLATVPFLELLKHCEIL